MQRIFIILMVVLIVFGCTSEVFIIEEPEKKPEIPFNADFKFDILDLTDRSVSIKFDYEVKGYLIDIVVNDSVVAYDINQLDFYKIENL